MKKDKSSKKKSASESFGDMVKEFGEAVSEIFKDPKLKEKAKEFGESAVESAKTFGDRFKDEDVKSKFKDVGKAAQNFGKSVADHFRDDKGKEEFSSRKKDKYSGESKVEEKVNKITKSAEKAGEKVDDYFQNTRNGRITGYSFSIAWNVIFLVFFNYFNKYIAYYNGETTDGITKWNIYPLITGDFNSWLPILTITLIVSIVGNIILIIDDRYFFRQIVFIVINLFGIATVVTLLSIFPFDFSVIPNLDLSNILIPIVTVVLILVAVGLGIGVLVRFIKFIVNISRASY